ncbi:hypothetical protein F5883DRAFT_551727 [Diaporthe sp. PMI_573]|nr:hypothetical protein F5883DRAFT_551727 [Diaporthaceae sp. PMI_573]
MPAPVGGHDRRLLGGKGGLRLLFQTSLTIMCVFCCADGAEARSAQDGTAMCPHTLGLVSGLVTIRGTGAGADRGLASTTEAPGLECLGP